MEKGKNKMRRSRILSALTAAGMLLSSIGGVTAFAEGDTQSYNDAEELVKSLLVDSSSYVKDSAKLSVSNSKQAAIFGEALDTVGFNEGIILSTGDATKSFSKSIGSEGYSGKCTDADLLKLSKTENKSQYGVYDYAVLEFKIIAQGDELSFNYAFGSREFNQNPKFNDLFGLFVNGENIAKLPNNEYVTINNIRGYDQNGKINSVDNMKYAHKPNGSCAGFNGITDVLTAKCDVTAGSEVTVKMAIADVGDSVYNSSVFIKANSLKTTNITVLSDGNGEAYANKSSGKVGENIVLTAKPASGYEFSHWEVIKGDITITNNSFVMCEGDVVVKAYFKAIENNTYNITVKTSAGGTAYASKSTANAGEIIKITAIAKSGYVIKSISCTQGGAVLNGNSFVMPQSDVVIYVMFEEDMSKYLMAARPFSYVFSYDSQMNPIKTNSNHDFDNYPEYVSIKINLGEEYAGKTGNICAGRKSNSKVIETVTLDDNGCYVFKADIKKNYSFVLED